MARRSTLKRLRSSVLVIVLAASSVLSPAAFGQSAPDALPNPLSLRDVTAFVHTHREEIAAARAQARAASERPAIVSALEDPMVFASLDHVPFMLHGVDASLSVEQRFPLSKVLGNRRRAAEADADRAKAEVDRVGLDMDLDAVTAFLMLEERRQIAPILNEQRALAEQFVRAASARYAAGTGAQADALRAEMEVARFDGAVRAITEDIRAAEAMLNASLGRSATAEVPDLGNSLVVSLPPPAGAVRRAALDQRPELRAGRAEIRRARAETSVMRSMYAPMAMVRTGPAYTMPDGAGWMLMVGVSVPIWRSRLSAGVAEAQAMEEMARSDVRAMQTMIEGQALVAREQLLAARERLLALAQQVVPRARQTMQPTLAGYASGQLPLVSVIDAAQALWNAQSELVSAQFELGLAWARLQRATANREAY